MISSLKEKLFIFVIILAAVFLKLFHLGEQIVDGIVLHNTLDFSWQSDMVERFLHGYIAGRDFIFTYGPFYQFIASLPALFFGQASYISVLYAHTFLLIFSLILLYLIITLLTYEKRERIFLLVYLVFFIGIIGYDSNSLFRILLPFFYSQLLLRLLSVKNKLSFRSIGLFALPSLFGMYTFDLFVLCLIITFLFILYRIFEVYKGKTRKSLLFFSVLTGFFQLVLVFVFAVLASFLLSGNLGYLIYSYDTLVNYQFIMSIPWSLHQNFAPFLFPIGLLFLLVYGLNKTRLNKNLKMSFCVLTIVSLLQLKSAFIRTDEGHVIMGIYPSLIVLFIIFYFILRERLRIQLLFIFLAFYLLIPFRENYFPSISSGNLLPVVTLATNERAFFEVYKLPDDYYFTKNDFAYFESLISKHPESVLVYPYDSYILNIYHTTFNTLPLQFYEYSHSIVEEKEVERLISSPPEFIILGIDSKGAVPLDDIAHFSRNPFVAKFMLHNYSVYKSSKKYLILNLDPNRKLKKVENKNDCTVFDLEVSEIMSSTMIERLGKTSTFYLNNIYTRLPYTAYSKDIFIVENVSDPDALHDLFDRGIDFTHFRRIKKKLKIIKKYPIPKFSSIYEESFWVKCY